MLAFLRPVWKTALLAAAVIALRITFEVTSVYLLSPAVTILAKLTPSGNAASFTSWVLGNDSAATQLRRVLLLMAGSQLAFWILIYLRNVWDCKLSMRAVFHIRSAVFNKLQHTGFAFHDRMTSGQLINRALSDLQTVRAFVNVSLLNTLDIVLSIGAYLALLYAQNHWLAVAALLPLPFWTYVILKFSRKAQPVYHAQQEAADRLMTVLTENVSGVHVVKGFGREAAEVEKYQEANRTLLRRLFAMVSLQQRLTPSLKLIAIGAHVLLFLVSAHEIKAGRMDVGDLMLLGVAMATILTKLQQINMIAEIYQKAVVSGSRLFEILDTPNVESRGDEALPLGHGTVELEEVSFGYDASKPVLGNVSLRIPGGRTTALLGPTGAGKSTLVSLIARFYDPQQGRITLDGKDVRALDVKELRKAVGFVFQETFLFSDTVRNNIRYGRDDVSDAMLEAAARVAKVDEFVGALPEGYDTRLGEGGVNLSGGQRQRLALARALVYDPRILILDDATAALDPETDEAVHALLPSFVAGRTVIVIAHRISTVKRAEHVVVLSDRRVVEQGTPTELMRCEGYFKKLVRLQTDEDIIAQPVVVPRVVSPQARRGTADLVV